MPLCSPHDGIGIMVDNDSDVLMALLVTGFIDTDTAKPVKPYSSVWLQPVVCSLNTVPNRTPVDVFEQADSGLGHTAYHPGNFIIEIRSKPGVSVFPGDILPMNTMLRALDPLRSVKNIDRDAVQIRCSPGRFSCVFCIIPGTFLHALRTEALFFLMRSGMNVNMFLLISLFMLLD